MNMEIKSNNSATVVDSAIVRAKTPTSAKDKGVKDKNTINGSSIQSNNVDKSSKNKEKQLSSTDTSEKELAKALTELNSSIQNTQRNLQFSLDKELGKIIINVKDKKTDEVVRQIPSEEFLAMARKMQNVYGEEKKSSSNFAETNSIFFNASA